MAKYVAIDLGASNGRVIVGDFQSFETMNRFVTRNEDLHGEIHWDIPYIFGEIKKGLKEAFKQFGEGIVSIGIDAWGVDHGLVDRHGSLVSLPYHYRDGRTDGLVEQLGSSLGLERVYQRTGIAFHSFNTLFQLAAMQRDRPEVFASADRYLSIPDLLNYWLCGVLANEVTHASTTQLYDPFAKDWAWDLIDELGFPRHLFGPLIPSGTVLGPLSESLRYELGASAQVQVVAVGSHDTASAVAAVPACTDDFPYISSGTWSLLGIESCQPIVNDEAYRSGFTNEVAVNGSIRFLKNIMGMWIQQECVRYWESMGEAISWKNLDQETTDCAAFQGRIDVDDLRFLKPNSHGSLMVDRIKDQCREAGRPIPSSKGEFMVAVYRGLAKTYAESIDHLQKMTGKQFSVLHVIGGGCKNEILDQWTADATGLLVQAGPVEATALGNMLVQAVALGFMGSLAQGRTMLRSSQKVKVFEPRGEATGAQ